MGRPEWGGARDDGRDARAGSAGAGELLSPPGAPLLTGEPTVVRGEPAAADRARRALRRRAEADRRRPWRRCGRPVGVDPSGPALLGPSAPNQRRAECVAPADPERARVVALGRGSGC